MSHVDLRHVTSAEVARFGPAAVGVLQVGATEQHGPHLPIGTDAFITEALVRTAAERVQEPVLVAPLINVGRSDHHLSFTGTISVPADVFDGLLEAHHRAFAAAGVSRVALVSAHAGNFAALRAFADRHGPDVQAYDDLGRFLAVMGEAAREVGLHPPQTDSHAGAYETSIILSLLGPAHVREFADVEGYTAAEPGWLERIGREGIAALSPSGVIGRPAGASAPAGLRILDALAAELAGWLTQTFRLTEATVMGCPGQDSF
jgi:creatinine amidohydrolase/Fe(II)-dependent formamide hydrolase-like protein